MFSKGKIKESDSTTTIISKNTSFVGDISSGEKIIILSPDISIRHYPGFFRTKLVKFPFYFKSVSKVNFGFVSKELYLYFEYP